MKSYEQQEGLSFILIFYTKKDKFYYMRFSELMKFWNRAKEGGRKSIRFDELDKEYFLPQVPGVLVPYLDMIQKDINSRD